MAHAESRPHARTTSSATARRPKVLVVRACRMSQFEVAVRQVRSQHPDAELIALSHRGHRVALEAAGVDRVIEVSGRRFGLLRLSPRAVWRLRAERLDTVVVPQMTASAPAHANLYRVVAALGAARVMVLPGDRPAVVYPASAFRGVAFRATLTSLATLADAPVLLGLLAIAAVLRPMGRAPVPGRTRKRVLLAISSLGVGGAQRQLAELLNRLPVDEYDVDLLVLGHDGDFSRPWLTRTDVTVSCVEAWPSLTGSVLEVAARCRQERYDLVHTWLFMANVIVAAGARLARVPYVMTSVRNLSVWKREAWYRKWWHRGADVLGSHAANLVTVNAQALVADHSRWALVPQSRIRVVHNGLDPSRFLADRRAARQQLLAATGAPDDAILVGTVGRLAPEKDQASFIRLLAQVRRERPDVYGVIIGGGELRASLEALAVECGLGDAVRFLGERADARQLMAGLDLFVLTSRSEGFPNVLLEATFFGIPCVATDIAGNPDVLVSRDALYDPADLQAGVACVADALADPRRAAVRAALARQHALDRFTSSQSVAAWLTLYRRALAPAGR